MKNKDSDLINSIKHNLLNAYPQISSMSIGIDKTSKRVFSSQIILRINSKSYFVSKKDESYKTSLKKSYNAIKRKIEKNAKNSFQHLRPDFSDVA